MLVLLQIRLILILVKSRHLEGSIHISLSLCLNMEDDSSKTSFSSHNNSSTILILDMTIIINEFIHHEFSLSSTTATTEDRNNQSPSTEIPKREKEEQKWTMSSSPFSSMSLPPFSPPLSRVSLEQSKTLMINNHSNGEWA